MHSCRTADLLQTRVFVDLILYVQKLQSDTEAQTTIFIISAGILFLKGHSSDFIVTGSTAQPPKTVV